jgi:DNA-binding transcriptional LysR family regulator
MDLNRIRVFVKVADARTFTEAARILGLPTSSVSRAVSALERELGVRLIQRTTRRLQLTDAGRAYYETVSRALSGIDEVAAAVSQMQDVPRGLVRITTPADLGPWLLPEALTRFGAKYEEVRVEVTLTQRIVDLVQEGIDLALRIGRLADTRLVARKIGLMRAGLFASSEYLRRKGVPRVPADLARHDCIAFRPVGGKVMWELAGPGGRESIEVRGAVGADDTMFVREMAAAGRGIAMLPIFARSDPFASEALTRVLPDHLTDGVPISLVHASSHFLSKRVALLRDHLLKELSTRLVG